MANENVPSAVTAPGLPAGVQVVETGVNDGAAKAPATTAHVSDTSGMNESQAAALRWVDANRAALAADMNNLQLLKNHKAALAHAFYGGPAPEFISNREAAKAEAARTDTRPADSLRAMFEEMAQPASEQQIRAAVDNAVVQGVSRELAQQAAAVCSEMGLTEGHTRVILDRVRAHHGADNDFAAASNVAILADHEMPEYAKEATRLFGSAEKFQDVSERAREFLAHRGLLAQFDESGLTRSTLAFDPKLLHTLAQAADMAGVPRGKR